MNWTLFVRGSMGQPTRRFPFGPGRQWVAGRYPDPAQAVARASSEGGSSRPLFGSEECYMPLEPDPAIFRWHLELSNHSTEGPWVRDLGSRSGTRLNGKLVTANQQYPLHLDDEIQVVKCKVHVAGSASMNPAWLAWRDGMVLKLARGIHETGALADLPVLGDALEEAGCTDADVLSSCRARNESARRSWVVDLLLGAE